MLVDGIRIHPVLTISFVLRYIRTKEPPPAGSSSKKIPCCLSSRVSLMWASLSGRDREVKPQRQAWIDLGSLSSASLFLCVLSNDLHNLSSWVPCSPCWFLWSVHGDSSTLNGCVLLLGPKMLIAFLRRHGQARGASSDAEKSDLLCCRPCAIVATITKGSRSVMSRVPFPLWVTRFFICSLVRECSVSHVFHVAWSVLDC